VGAARVVLLALALSVCASPQPAAAPTATAPAASNGPSDARTELRSADHDDVGGGRERGAGR
jgi:hypothetical protein